MFKVTGLDDLEIEHILQQWNPRFMAAFSKRAGGVMRGRTKYAVRKRTGKLRRSVKTSHTYHPRWGRGANANGEIGVITYTADAAPSASDAGYFHFVEVGVSRWARSYHARRTAGAVGRGVMRKVAAEQNARTAAR